MQPLDPIPQSDPLIDPSQRMNDRWYRWLSGVIGRFQTSGVVLAATHLAGQTGSIAVRTLLTPSQPGLYRFNWYLQVTTPGTTSSIQGTVTWKTNGVTQTRNFPAAALTGNLTTTQDGDCFAFRPDSGSPVQWSTTYASTGTPMAYTVDVACEEIT